ncbi:MAG TPA: hypothetical protein VMO47_14985 [Rhodothermales bacterium]|nr:hypothetical protein [Rhodothermales bacterium]
MHRIRQIAAAAALLSVMLPELGWGQAASIDRLFRTQDDNYFHTPLGLCEDYPEESTTLEIIEGDLDLLNETGIDLLRISFGWDGIEGEKDQYDWLFWDDFVQSAVDKHGVTLIPYICYTPLWNSTTDDINNSWHYPPKDYEEFGEFVYDLVSRYKDRIKTWEIWNEPDIWIFWAGNQEEFARLLKTGSEAVRRADPEAKVVMGGLANDTEWLESLFRDHGVSPYVDVVNIHNYFETWAGKPLEDVAGYVHEVARIVDAHGDAQAIWMAEVGYSTFRDSSFVSDKYSAYYEYEHTPEYQAVDLIRRVTTALSTQKLSALAWYEIKDLQPGEETIGDFGNNGNLGIVWPDYTPKPAQQALKFFNRLMASPSRTLPATIETEEARRDLPVDLPATIETDDTAANLTPVVHAFDQADGDVIIVGWLPTFDPHRTHRPGRGMHKDERSQTVKVNLPLGVAESGLLYNELGESKPFDAISTEGSRSTITVTLKGGSIAILEMKKP